MEAFLIAPLQGGEALIMYTIIMANGKNISHCGTSFLRRSREYLASELVFEGPYFTRVRSERINDAQTKLDSRLPG